MHTDSTGQDEGLHGPPSDPQGSAGEQGRVAPEASEETPEERRERMRELGRRSGEARRKKALERAANGGGMAPGDPHSQYAGGGAARSDLATARQALLDVISDTKSPQAAVVAAARALADLDQKSDAYVPHSVAEIQALSTPELHNLIRRLDEALQPA